MTRFKEVYSFVRPQVFEGSNDNYIYAVDCNDIIDFNTEKEAEQYMLDYYGNLCPTILQSLAFIIKRKILVYE